MAIVRFASIAKKKAEAKVTNLYLRYYSMSPQSMKLTNAAVWAFHTHSTHVHSAAAYDLTWTGTKYRIFAEETEKKLVVRPSFELNFWMNDFVFVVYVLRN